MFTFTRSANLIVYRENMFFPKVKFMLLFITLMVVHIECEKLISLQKTFEKGVKAYNDERWSRCIDMFEESLHLYKMYKSVLINCRLKCNSESPKLQVKENIDDLKIYEHFFNKRDCVSKCQDIGFHDSNLNSSLEDHTLYNMQAMKPYEYLHICYFHMRMFFNAASSAYTYLLANPNDETMKSNLQYYMEQPEVDATEIVDLESEDYTVLYKLGQKSYRNDNWAETIASMEEVLKDYIASENRCRAECERQPGQEWSVEFVNTISNNIASLLHCHQQCQDRLKFLKFNSGVEFLADVLNYLQISYYHLEKYEESAKTVASFLALLPHDKAMLANAEFYMKHVDKSAFVERSNIVHYSKRDAYEKNLLEFFHQGKNYGTDNNSI